MSGDALLLRLRNFDSCNRYHTRPPLLASLARVAGLGLGVAATAGPQRVQYAVLGALQDVATEQYNEQLRTLREAGLSEEVSDVPHGAYSTM